MADVPVSLLVELRAAAGPFADWAKFLDEYRADDYERLSDYAPLTWPLVGEFRRLMAAVAALAEG